MNWKGWLISARNLLAVLGLVVCAIVLALVVIIGGTIVIQQLVG